MGPGPGRTASGQASRTSRGLLPKTREEEESQRRRRRHREKARRHRLAHAQEQRALPLRSAPTDPGQARSAPHQGHRRAPAKERAQRLAAARILWLRRTHSARSRHHRRLRERGFTRAEATEPRREECAEARRRHRLRHLAHEIASRAQREVSEANLLTRSSEQQPIELHHAIAGPVSSRHLRRSLFGPIRRSRPCHPKNDALTGRWRPSRRPGLPSGTPPFPVSGPHFPLDSVIGSRTTAAAPVSGPGRTGGPRSGSSRTP